MIIENYISNTKTDYKIPNIIIQIWQTRKVNKVHYDALSSWKKMNPNHTYLFFSANELEQFIKENYEAKILNYYKKIKNGTLRSDFGRILLLYVFGGIYIDCGAICIKPLDHILSKNDTFITPLNYVANQMLDYDANDFFLQNGFICCTARHPIIKLYIDQIINNIKNKFYGDNFYEPTGPGLFYKIVSSYLNIKKLKKGSNIGKNNDIVRLLVLPKLKEKKSKLSEFELRN